MSRRRVAVVSVVVAAAIAVPALTEATASGGHYVAAPASCGTARWPVKTLSDSAAASLDTHRVPTTIVGLSAFHAPAHIGDTLPRQAAFQGAEFKVYTETVRLVGWKTEADSDIHVEVRALAGPQTMVVEFPLAGCIRTSASPTNRTRMARAKAALLKACGPAPGSSGLSPLKGVATVTGVGFYDKRSHATGSALNGIELHPVIAFSSTTCRAGP